MKWTLATRESRGASRTSARLGAGAKPRERLSHPEERIMTNQDAKTVAKAYVDAAGKRRWDGVEELLAPGVVFRMPGREIVGAAPYVAALRRLGPVLLRYDVKDVVAEGERACVLYDFVTDSPAGAVPSVEWLTVRDGKIQEATLVFHTAPWPQVLEALARRTAASVA